jgi:nuclear pore complex protein Nup85
MPPDPTNAEDTIQSLLLLGKPGQTLTQAHHLDPWLSAHFADVMESVGLIDREPME